VLFSRDQVLARDLLRWVREGWFEVDSVWILTSQELKVPTNVVCSCVEDASSRRGYGWESRSKRVAKLIHRRTVCVCVELQIAIKLQT
jgi:hypothetical protein